MAKNVSVIFFFLILPISIDDFSYNQKLPSTEQTWPVVLELIADHYLLISTLQKESLVLLFDDMRPNMKYYGVGKIII